MKLYIEVQFDTALSPQAQADVKRAVQNLKEELYLGRVTRADLVTEPVADVPRTAPAEGG